ncbi:uncharacterized protein tedc2 [Diretmus argenteus]
MSLLTGVQEAIDLCKAEQAKIDVNIHLLREMLQSLTPSQTKNASEDSELADAAAAKDPDIPLEEKEEIELLERALEKALWIRTGTGPSKEAHDKNEQSGPHKEPGGATFSKDWPCGSPDQTRDLVDKLTHQGQDLTQYYQTTELLAKQASAAGTGPGTKENKYESCLTLESLERTAAKLRKSVDQVKREWEAWDRWRPEGGCLCPIGANAERGDTTIAPLPPTVTYTTEAELRELEKLRMSVALLQQEMYLQQALSDTLFPQLSSVIYGPGCPNPAVLRDMYSLLGEGGEQFPALVLDTEPD